MYVELLYSCFLVQQEDKITTTTSKLLLLLLLKLPLCHHTNLSETKFSNCFKYCTIICCNMCHAQIHVNSYVSTFNTSQRHWTYSHLTDLTIRDSRKVENVLQPYPYTELTCTTALDPLTSSTWPLRVLPSCSVSFTISANLGNCNVQEIRDHD